MKRTLWLIAGSILLLTWSGGRTAPASPSAPLVLDPPQNFQGEVISSSEIRWTWDDTIGETHYELHDSAHNVIEVLGQDETQFIEAGLTPGVENCRHIAAFAGPDQAESEETCIIIGQATLGVKGPKKITAPGVMGQVKAGYIVTGLQIINKTVCPPPVLSVGSNVDFKGALSIKIAKVTGAVAHLEVQLNYTQDTPKGLDIFIEVSQPGVGAGNAKADFVKVAPKKK